MSRGKRRKAQGEEPTTIEEFNEVSASAAKRAWARLIKQVYEADPLICPRCTGPMRIIAFIEQPEVIEKILTHLARLSPQPAGGGTRCHIPCNGSYCRVIISSSPDATGRRGRPTRLPGACSMRVGP